MTTSSCGSPACGCGGSAAPAVDDAVARINGIALHAPGEQLPDELLRQRACTELLRQQAQREGLLAADDAPGLDGATSEVTVVLDGHATTAPMPRDRPVLDSARARRGDVPFACKGGVCGTCRARVVEGEVDLVRNYALEPAELAAGFVLTCQSFPLSERITIDYDA